MGSRAGRHYYRYAVNQEGGVAVRSVIHEYLATKVIWSD